MKNLLLVCSLSLFFCSLAKAEFLSLPECDSDLWNAARENSYEEARGLLEKGTSANCFGPSNMTPLQAVVFKTPFSNAYKTEAERISFARLLLKFHATESINSQDSNSDTALTEATKYEAPRLLKLLLDHGANPNTLGSSQLAPLHRVALLLDSPSLIDILLLGGADINVRDGEMQATPIIFAAGDETSPAKLKKFISTGADLEIADKTGRTPLIIASQNTAYRSAEYLGLLLAAGANANAKDSQGATALKYAEQRGDKDAVKVLLKHGAHH